MTRRVIFPPTDYWTTPKENPMPAIPPTEDEDEYGRLVAFTRLLWDVAEMLRIKGRTDAAEAVHAEAVHFATERDIAKAVADTAEELDNPIVSEDLGRLDD